MHRTNSSPDGNSWRSSKNNLRLVNYLLSILDSRLWYGNKVGNTIEEKNSTISPNPNTVVAANKGLQ